MVASVTDYVANQTPSGVPAEGQSSGALGKARLAENFETFLTLLTAQLRNQDPLSPMDSNAFTAQIVQMTGVEQQLLTNDLLKKMVEVQGGGSGLDKAVSYIGKTVTAAGNATTLKEGKAEWAYELAEDANKVTVEIVNTAGKVVFKKEITTGEGRSEGVHKFAWDGKDTDGKTAPDGIYKLKVTAVDELNKSLEAQTLIRGKVTSVETYNGETVLNVAGSKVLLDALIAIEEAAAEAAKASTTLTSNNSTTSQNGASNGSQHATNDPVNEEQS
jgi:flagellar basal-body rod modification protein FlgD